MTEKWKKGDLVTITITGTIEQITESGYLVSAHGVSIPVLKSAIIDTQDTGWTDQDLDELAAITPADLAAASTLWEQTAPLKGLLSAEKDRDQ